MRTTRRYGTARTLTALLGTTMLAVVAFAGPAAADDTSDSTSEDNFEASNAAGTIEIDSVVDISHAPGTDDDIWTPGTSVVQVTLDVGDANTLHGTTYVVCLENEHAGVDCLDIDNAVETGEWEAAVFGLAEGAQVDEFDVSSNIGSWAVSNAQFTAGDYGATAATISVDIDVSKIARKTSTDRWRVVALAYEGVTNVHDETGYDYQVEGYVEAFSGVSDRALGSVATNAWGASIVSQSLTNITANADWKIDVLAIDDEWARSGGGAPAELVTSGSPGVGEFALRCASGVDPDTSTGQYIGAVTPVSVASATGSALLTESATGSTNLRCRIRNGATAAGTYTGTVQTTLTLQ